MKSILFSIALLLTFSISANAQKEQTNVQKERSYTITVPEHLIQPFYSIINGGSVDNLTVGQMKELTKVVNEQVTPQYRKYYIEDSTAQARIKADSTTHKK